MLNGQWDYAAYTAICAELGVKPDAQITTFTDRIGFYVAAIFTFPEKHPIEACEAYAKQSMVSFAQKDADDSNVQSVTFKPCCGGGKVR